jgi:hypothetical protein
MVLWYSDDKPVIVCSVHRKTRCDKTNDNMGHIYTCNNTYLCMYFLYTSSKPVMVLYWHCILLCTTTTNLLLAILLLLSRYVVIVLILTCTSCFILYCYSHLYALHTFVWAALELRTTSCPCVAKCKALCSKQHEQAMSQLYKSLPQCKHFIHMKYTCHRASVTTIKWATSIHHNNDTANMYLLGTTMMYELVLFWSKSLKW